MSTYLGKVTAKGQLTLPKEVRDKLLFQTGDYLEMEIRGRELVVRSAAPMNEIALLREYAAPYAADAPELQDLRQRMRGLRVSVTDEIRAVREEES